MNRKKKKFLFILPCILYLSPKIVVDEDFQFSCANILEDHILFKSDIRCFRFQKELIHRLIKRNIFTIFYYYFYWLKKWDLVDQLFVFQKKKRKKVILLCRWFFSHFFHFFNQTFWKTVYTSIDQIVDERRWFFSIVNHIVFLISDDASKMGCIFFFNFGSHDGCKLAMFFVEFSNLIQWERANHITVQKKDEFRIVFHDSIFENKNTSTCSRSHWFIQITFFFSAIKKWRNKKWRIHLILTWYFFEM